MSANPNAVSNQGEFHSSVAPSKPLTTHGHAIGEKVGNDAAPEFHAKTLPAGSAPKDRTFTPNTQNEIPGQAMNPDISKETWTSAQSTIIGATSADVNTGMGKPIGPQGSKELHHDGGTPGKRERTGLTGVESGDREIQSDAVRETGRDLEYPRSTKGGGVPENVAGAEERLPVSAGELASETK